MFEKELLEILSLPPEQREEVLKELIKLIAAILKDRDGFVSSEFLDELARWLN